VYTDVGREVAMCTPESRHRCAFLCSIHTRCAQSLSPSHPDTHGGWSNQECPPQPGPCLLVRQSPSPSTHSLSQARGPRAWVSEDPQGCVYVHVCARVYCALRLHCGIVYIGTCVCTQKCKPVNMEADWPQVGRWDRVSLCR
jgi:hypothetical protein